MNQTRFSNRVPRIYLDYAASTPVAKEVFKAMKPYFIECYGNPGSVHYFGQAAQTAVDKSREIIAKSIGAGFNEIIFTGSATEANNLALRGLIKAYQHKSAVISINQRPRIIVSSIEHESVLGTAKDLEREGVEVVYLPVDKEGFVNIEALKNNLTENTVLVSVTYANNEIGTIQPITEISKIIRNFREELKPNSKFQIPNSLFPLFHTDAVQAFQFLDCDINNLAIDLMTISAHKIYGPKGVGALYMRQNNELRIKNYESDNMTVIHNSSFIVPIITGGSQEYGLRSGTENVPAIVGFGKAVELVEKNKIKESKRIKTLRDYFWRKLKTIEPNLELNGPPISSLDRLHNNLNIYFPDRSSEDLLIKLDLNGIAVSRGSACSLRSAKLSYVVSALNLGENRARSSLRISFGRPTTKKQLDIVLKSIINLL